MKSILALVIALSLYINVSGQLWKPYILNAKCIYGYVRTPVNIELTGICYDSVYRDGEIEIAYAYTGSYLNDACLDSAYNAFRFDANRPYPIYWVTPIPIEIRFQKDSIVSPEFTLLTNPHIGQEWDDYTFEGDSMMSVLGILDSVKIYSYAQYSHVILSKHFGLIRIKDRVLMGFKTDSITLGLSLPSIENSIKLAPGDLLYYRTIKDTTTFSGNSRYFLYADTRDSITAVTITNDTLSIDMIRQELNYVNTDLSFDNQTIKFNYYLPELNNIFQDGALGERYRNDFYSKRPVVMQMTATDTIYTVRLVKEGQFSGCTFSSMFDICYDESFSSNTIMLASTSCNAIYGGGTETTLIGSRIGNTVTGPIHLGVQKPAPELLGLTVSPNPSSDVLNLSSSADEISYTIIDLLGNTCLKGKTVQSIPIQSLPSGLYMLIVSTPNESKIFRVAKK